MIQKNIAWNWKTIKINPSWPGKKNFKKEIVWDPQGQYQASSLGVLEQEERVIGWEFIWRNKRNIPEAEKETDVQIQEAQKKSQKQDKPPKMHTKTPYNWTAKTKK